MIEACVNANGVDGSTGRHILEVDGMPAEASYAIVAMLGCIVKNGVAPGFKACVLIHPLDREPPARS